MLSIGEFSKICQVSTKALRYYAEIGLINPEEINPENGYRYYSIKQLDTMILINRLKAYDFSLEEIKSILLLDKIQFSEKLLFQLHKKKQNIEEKVKSYEDVLRELEQDMVKLESGNNIITSLADMEIRLIEMAPMYILSIRKLVSMEECSRGYEPFFNLLHKRIAENSLTMAGPPMTIYHSAEYLPGGYDIEFAIPIREFVTGTKDFSPGLCIKTRLEGPYSEITAIYARQREWLERENYSVAMPPFDVYLTNPLENNNPKGFITDIYLPVKKN